MSGKNCGDPGNIENGYRKISGYVFTSSVNYFCNDGYILAGRALHYCQSDGHWGGELPVCKRKFQSMIITLFFY